MRPGGSGEGTDMKRLIIGLLFTLATFQPVFAAGTGRWHYYHVNARTQKNFAPLITDYVNGHGPKPGGLMGALSGGSDFHIWVRDDQAGTKWVLKVNDPKRQPTSGSLKFLRDEILTRLDACKFAVVAFNRSSPPRLWFFERIDSVPGLCP
jgi:hypothetical protein